MLTPLIFDWLEYLLNPLSICPETGKRHIYLQAPFFIQDNRYYHVSYKLRVRGRGNGGPISSHPAMTGFVFRRYDEGTHSNI